MVPQFVMIKDQSTNIHDIPGGSRQLTIRSAVSLPASSAGPDSAVDPNNLSCPGELFQTEIIWIGFSLIKLKL